MKKIFQLGLGLCFAGFGYAQNLKPIAQKVKTAHEAGKSFIKYDFFTENASATNKYAADAADVTVMKLNKSEIARISSEKPEALEMDFQFEGKTLTLDLVKNNFFTNDFKVNTDKGYTNYIPGVYYQGIVKGDTESLVAVTFFENEVMGVTSIKNVGNIILGKAKNSDDYVSFNDQKMKGSNPFSCGADELVENQKNIASFDPKQVSAKKTENCVRIFYEAGYGPYTQNNSSVTATTNWVTAMHNNISTLYANDGITVALSEVFVWTTTDPFTGSPSQILNQYRNYRTTFNGDVAQLLRNPATTSIAWVDALCSTYKYSYSGVNSYYSNVPAYSWNIEAMTHEIGHNLGSPHTHACAWNGNSTAIDGCGPASGNDEGCNAPLPTNGGTIMSYCHLVSSVGINFANGFGPQPGALIRNTVNSRGCLGTNCVTSCPTTTTIQSSNITANSATVTITDNVALTWKYKLTKIDGSVVTSGNTTNKTLNFSGLQQGTYYRVSVGTDCSGPQAFTTEQVFLTDANWCSGVSFNDSGGETSNYGNNETFVKTFYPNSGSQLKLTFTEFDTESGYDFMNVYNGPSTSSPKFSNGNNLSGTTVPGPFTSTHSTGAITVTFVADPGVTGGGWKSTFQCLNLATGETSKSDKIQVAKTQTSGIFTLTADENILGYQVFDASGKMVKNVGKVASKQEKIDLTSSPAGTYMVNIKTANEIVTRKIIR